MKGLQVWELLISLPLLVLCLSGVTYFLGTFNLRLALMFEFSLLSAILVVWFIILDRVLNRA
jgi:hypothetical protein